MAGDTCYCASVRPFSADPLIILLVHPKEMRMRIGTARIVKLCITNSVLLSGEGPELDQDERLKRILEDESLWPVILYPGSKSINLSELSPSRIAALPPPGRRPAIFILDGTWHSAGKMLRTSKRLSSLPQIALTPKRESQYRIRRQPRSGCLSTVEAAYEVISLFSPSRENEERSTAPERNLLEVFDRMVSTQILCEAQAASEREHPSLP